MMSRRPLIAGNWKMHTTIPEAKSLATSLADKLSGVMDRDIAVAPPFTVLSAVGKVLSGSNIWLSAQNVCWEEKGAYTGEISPVMLKETGCRIVIVGHSERRHIFNESNALINKRLLGALQHGLVPIFCVGETLTEREKNLTFTMLEKQVQEGLSGVVLSDPADLVVAYEPVWAIGTGKTATEKQAEEVHAFVRGLLDRLFTKDIASHIRILYGGSVNPKNVDVLMAQENVDGVLVGGASLTVESFVRIVQFQ